MLQVKGSSAETVIREGPCLGCSVQMVQHDQTQRGGAEDENILALCAHDACCHCEHFPTRKVMKGREQ